MKDKYIIGITGGIGSGKSTIVDLLQQRGLPVYVADTEAKRLMNSNENIRTKIIEVFGEESYENNQLNRPFLAKQVFEDESKLEQLNRIVHPEVHKDFLNWASKQTSKSVLYEAAILIEQGRQDFCDAVILITAPKEERIKRVMKRDGVTKEEVLARMERQWSDDKKKNFANISIENNNLNKIQENIDKIVKYLKDNHFL